MEHTVHIETLRTCESGLAPQLCDKESEMSISDVMIHIEQALSADARSSLEERVRQIDGIEYGGAATFFEFAGESDICLYI